MPEESTVTAPDAVARIHDEQPIATGKLDEDEKLDIALQGSMMTSEPPQLAEPRTAEDDVHGD
jgi:hypothetical protein